jgi:transcriptional regulator with XRE-family HTH domain
MAGKLNISRVRYNQYETGKRQPDNEILKAIANFHKVTVDYLIGNDDINPETLVAFKDFQNLTDTDKQEIINFIKFKNQLNKQE